MEKLTGVTSISKPSSTIQSESTGTTSPREHGRLWIVLALLALYLIWGSTYFFIRIAIISLPPFLMTGVRMLVAGSILYVILRLRGQPAPTRAEWGGSARMGLFLIGGGMGGVAFAEQWVASSVTATCIATTPLWISLFSGLWGRWPVRAEWLGLVVGFSGVVLLNVGSGLWASPLGAVVLIFSPMCWAFGSAWSQRLILPNGLMASAAEMLFGGSLLAYTAYIYVLRRVRPTLATSYAYINPLVAVCLGVFFAGDHITPLGVVGMVVILTGVVLVSLARERKTKDTPKNIDYQQ